MYETLPLTPTMRALLEAMPRESTRQMMQGVAGVFAIIAAIAFVVLAWRGQLTPGIALMFVVSLALTVLAIGAYNYLWRRGLRRDGLHDGTATRYTGPLRARWPRRGLPRLVLPDREVTINHLLPERRAAVRALDSGTALYSPANNVIFAIWDAEGRCLHRFPGFGDE